MTPAPAARLPVYPRVCGGTQVVGGFRAPPEGLSPRVRGNPIRFSETRRPQRVYPRVCGGTLAPVADLHHIEGLSPRVRGNPSRSENRIEQRGSIPACAGEPASSPAGASITGVYPRVCGGTNTIRTFHFCFHGLSPRVRGNPHPAADCAAGCQVYPRVCGGTRRRWAYHLRR